MTPTTIALLGLLQPAAAQEEPDTLLSALETELTRTMEGYAGQDAPPYFLSYRARDRWVLTLDAQVGAMMSADQRLERDLDVHARVGSPARDSSHRLKDDWGDQLNHPLGLELPVDGDELALRAIAWQATDKAVRDAQEAWHRVQADLVVKVVDQDDSGDLAPVQPVVDLRPRVVPQPPQVDTDAWSVLLAELSGRVQDDPRIHTGGADLYVQAEDRYTVTSEGTRVRHPRVWARIAMWGFTRADDGMNLRLYRWHDAASADRLPDADTLRAWADELQSDLRDLREAPAGEPYSGPVLLRGKAAGVFVHEVLGHRVEGHRQKDSDEGQTFTDKVGQAILPPSISVFDDPGLATWEGMDLNGHYAYDEEGVPGQRADIVRDGVFTGFLMSRAPVEGFAESNGHGRAQHGRDPVARMANTIVDTTEPLSERELRRRLVAEVAAQGRDWGLVVDDIAGGFTLTGRVFPNAFNVRAVRAWRVYADGRPDELVRGVDLVGTPLVALGQVIAAGDDPQVFNGFCGAESGSVPNSAVSPSLLLALLEIQKKEVESERPPLLPKPTHGEGS